MKIPPRWTLDGGIPEWASRVEIHLDGRRVVKCTGWDQEAGWVERRVVDAQGQVVLAYDGLVPYAPIERVYGKVTLKWKATGAWRSLWPWARIATLIILGLCVVKAINVWNAKVEAKIQEVNRDTRAFLKAITARQRSRDSLRAVQDSLGLIQDSLSALDASLAAALDETRRHQGEEQAALAALPFDSLLEAPVLSELRFEVVELPPMRLRFALDSVDVRFIATRFLERNQERDRRIQFQVLAEVREERIETFIDQLAATIMERNTLQEDLLDAQDLLERHLALRSCRILPFIACPSRTVSAVLGFAGGVGITYFLVK